MILLLYALLQCSSSLVYCFLNFTGVWIYRLFVYWIVAGCGPVAVAQVIAFHGHMDLHTNERDAIRGMAPNFNRNDLGRWEGNTRVNGRIRGYNFSLINNRVQRNSPQIINGRSTQQQMGEVAALMYHLFNQLGAIPIVHTDGTGNKTGSVTVINNANIDPVLRRFGYTVVSHNNATTATGTANNFSVRHNVNISVVTNALNGGLPIIVRGNPAAGGTGHIWVIDGHGTMTSFTEVYRRVAPPHNDIHRIVTLQNEIFMVHCNMGWDGNHRGGISASGYTGWFIYGIFDTTIRRNNPTTQNITAGAGNYSTGVRLIIATPNR